MVVWCSELIQNALGGRCPDLALPPTKNSHACVLNISVSMNVVLSVQKLPLYMTPFLAGPIFDNFPKEIFLNLISRTAISPDFASFFKQSKQSRRESYSLQRKFTSASFHERFFKNEISKTSFNFLEKRS